MESKPIDEIFPKL